MLISSLFLILFMASVHAQTNFKLLNGQDALRLNANKGNFKSGSPCSPNDVICAGTQVGLCVFGSIVTQSCAAPLECFVLPLVLRRGTAIACTTLSDFHLRIKDSGALEPSASIPTTTMVSTVPTKVIRSPVHAIISKPTHVPAKSTKSFQEQIAGFDANDFVCTDNTTFMHFTAPGVFVTQQCPPGFCATRHPPNKNPCIGAANAERIDNIPPGPIIPLPNK